MGEVIIIGVDLAKNVFQLHGAAADGSNIDGGKRDTRFGINENNGLWAEKDRPQIYPLRHA